MNIALAKGHLSVTSVGVIRRSIVAGHDCRERELITAAAALSIVDRRDKSAISVYSMSLFLTQLTASSAGADHPACKNSGGTSLTQLQEKLSGWLVMQNPAGTMRLPPTSHSRAIRVGVLICLN